MTGDDHRTFEYHLNISPTELPKHHWRKQFVKTTFWQQHLFCHMEQISRMKYIKENNFNDFDIYIIYLYYFLHNQSYWQKNYEFKICKLCEKNSRPWLKYKTFRIPCEHFNKATNWTTLPHNILVWKSAMSCKTDWLTKLEEE